MVYQKELPAMATKFTYQVLLKNGLKEIDADAAIERAHLEVLQIQNRYSEFDQNSFLSLF